jgi:hypothetical protein
LDSQKAPTPVVIAGSTGRKFDLVPKTIADRSGWKLNPDRKVAIVGFASSSRNQAPFDDTSFEIWGLNSLYAFLPRWDRWYEIHPREHIAKDLNRAELKQLGTEHVDWLKKQSGPVEGEKFRPIYMQDHYDDIPASVRWPREEINKWTTAMFGPQAELDYFTSTPGEMMAHAIFEGAGEIHLYGIDLLQSEEYAYQRPGCEYWIGIARGLGIRVYVPQASAMLKANYVYGYTEPPSTTEGMAGLVTFFNNTRAKIEQEQQKAAAFVNMTTGTKQAFEWIIQQAAEGKSMKDILEFANKRLPEVNDSIKQGVDALNRMSAQVEFAGSAASWTEHYGRGGKLEGM